MPKKIVSGGRIKTKPRRNPRVPNPKIDPKMVKKPRRRKNAGES